MVEVNPQCAGPFWARVPTWIAHLRRLKMEAENKAAVEVNQSGGRQSRLSSSLVLLPWRAVLRVGRVMKTGAQKYESEPGDPAVPKNWHKIPSHEHLDHLLEHAARYLSGTGSEDDAGHVATRAMMFLEMYLRETGEEP